MFHEVYAVYERYTTTAAYGRQSRYDAADTLRLPALPRHRCYISYAYYDSYDFAAVYLRHVTSATSHSHHQYR